MMNPNQWNHKLNREFVKFVIIGTAGADCLPGTAGDDSIVGLQGNDEIYGGGGDDWIYADDGNDYADGGWGRDRVYGTIEGAAVNGSLVGGWGALAHSSWNSLFS